MLFVLCIAVYIYNVFSCFCNCMFLSWTCCRNLEHQLKEIRMNQDEMMAGQRGSRISKWIQHSSTMRDRAGWQAPEKIQSLVLVIEMFFFFKYCLLPFFKGILLKFKE